MNIWLTGCTAGLGKALVKELVKQGHVVFGGGRNEISLQSLSSEYSCCSFHPLDVVDTTSVNDFVKQGMKATGYPDILINNAAMMNVPNPLWKVPEEEFNQLTAVNINGVANMIREVVPLMIDSKKGIVVNLSSGWGRSTSPEVAPYCASKWAIEGLTQALSQELPSGLAAVALNPGVINTDMLKKCYGKDASDFPSPEDWAKLAGPFIINLKSSNNGNSLTVS